MAVDVTATLTAPCPPSQLLELVSDLSTYPNWLEIVPRAEPAGDGDRLAWMVDLRGRLGPLARSKRLRMVRTRCDESSAVFERQELDGRSHSPWVLDASVAGTDEGSTLTMRLHYGGRLWGPLMERMLSEEIERSRPRLLALVSG